MSAAGKSPRPSTRTAWRLSLREVVRAIAIAGLAIAGVVFVFFARYVSTGSGTPVPRPEAADAFLPLGGIAALKAWIATGHLDTLHPAAVVILIATLVTAWIFRRALCAWLCPLGAVSEYLARLGKRVFGRNLTVPRWLDRTLIALKYVGTFALLWLLFSTPSSQMVAFMSTPFYSVADMELFSIYAHIGLLGVLVLTLIGVASMLVKSFWCRYLCPYGAVQGILGVLSPVSIAKDDSRCTGCARCNAACPNAVDIAGASGAVTSAECIGCTSCVQACPRPDTLRLRLLGRIRVQPAEFGLAFVAVFVALILGAVVTGHWASSLSAQNYHDIFATATGVHLPGL